MQAIVEPVHVERFRAIVRRLLGLRFDDTRTTALADALRDRAQAHGTGCDAYLDALEADPTARLVGELADAVTVGETYFFRNIDQFKALAEVALPRRVAARGAERRVRILSAGCASGEEAYSLAIVARERVPDPAWSVTVVGVDVNPVAVRKAVAGKYSEWSLRETSGETRRRWFTPEGREAVLDRRVREAVRFELRNLAVDDAELFPRDTYDVVFCRNVLMYFEAETARAVVARIARSLAPGGFLFLGHAETLRGLSNDFHLCHTHGTFYYERKERVNAREARAAPGALGAPGAADGFTSYVAASAPVDVAPAATDWVELIRTSSERIQSLSNQPTPAANARAQPHGAPRWDLVRPLELMRQERFVEALQVLRDLPAESNDRPEVLLLGAVLHTQSGSLERAEELCARLLEQDELSASAHYVMALCREAAGDARSAMEHDQVATYLDAGLAMPRFHLGLLARRRGELELARRELEHALELLRREDSSRLLLFGGGFTREALVHLCLNEIVACGGAR